MGQTHSCKRSIEVCPQRVRIVDVNGQVDTYTAPVKVKQVLQQRARHFLCCSRDLHTIATSRPLPAEEELRLGEIYFLLPVSALDSDLSPKNLAALATRLLAAVKKDAARSKARDMNRIDGSDKFSVAMHEKLIGGCDNPELQMAYKELLLAKARSWRPCLHTIEETRLAH